MSHSLGIVLCLKHKFDLIGSQIGTKVWNTFDVIIQLGTSDLCKFVILLQVEDYIFTRNNIE